MLAFQAACARAQFKRRECRGVINKYWRLGQQADGVRKTRPIVIFKLAGAHLVRINASERRHHAHRQLFAWHFHTEDRHRQLAAEGGALGNVHGERGFPHRRAPGHNYQIARLQAGGHVVQIFEAGRHAGGRRVGTEQGVNAIDRLGQQALERREPAAPVRALLADVKDAAFREVENIRGVTPFRTVRAAGDTCGGVNQITQNGALAHNVGVGADVRGARGIVGDGSQISEPACVLQLVIFFQPLGDGHHIRRAARFDQRGNGAVDEAVFLAVEVVRGDFIGDPVEGLPVQQQSAEDGLLRLNRLWRNFERISGRLAAPRFGAILHRTSAGLSLYTQATKAACVSHHYFSAFSATTDTVILKLTSVCRLTGISKSPICLSGPLGR